MSNHVEGLTSVPELSVGELSVGELLSNHVEGLTSDLGP